MKTAQPHHSAAGSRTYIWLDPDHTRWWVTALSRLLHVFVLRPDLIPLPRALCILRYKSLQFLEKSTIGDNEFRDSLKYAGYSSDQVKSLQDWLDEPVNLKWIRDNSVNKVAEALKNSGITAKPPKDIEDH